MSNTQHPQAQHNNLAPTPREGDQGGSQELFPARLQLIDSHTEGEPTRVVIDGWPQPVGDDMEARRSDLLARFEALRRAVVCEPRGHDAIVGALLTPPVVARPDEPEAAAGVIFFNNAGYLGMCGHGLIGVVKTLEHLGRITPGTVLLDTPVGRVGAELAQDGSVTIRNVPARCAVRDAEVDVPGLGKVRGDIAWGGNWFFLADLPQEQLRLERLDRLLDVTRRILAALDEQGITGDDGGRIDHVELFGPPQRSDADSRNFVLCPGGEYDRSPCGTGTSAKMAALHARGKLTTGERWRQESITGGLFEGHLEAGADGELIPYIQAQAFITAETVLHFHPGDPFRGGFSRWFA